LDQPYFFARKPPLPRRILAIARQKRPEWQLKKGVNGHAAGINGRYAGGCHDDHPLRAFRFELVQKRGFASARFAGQKNILVRVALVVESEFELWI